MTKLRLMTWMVLPAATLALAGCSCTKMGKCNDCQSVSVYPSQPCYDCQQPAVIDSYDYAPGQPAPLPSAEPLPVPPAADPNLPPPPPEAAVRARPIQEISATTRGLYHSMSNNIRAMFSR